jgi:hypothetical protein
LFGILTDARLSFGLTRYKMQRPFLKWALYFYNIRLISTDRKNNARGSTSTGFQAVLKDTGFPFSRE